MKYESCRQNAGFNTVSPTLVPAGKVWLINATDRQVTDLRWTLNAHGVSEPEVTSHCNCSKMADFGPPSYLSMFGLGGASETFDFFRLFLTRVVMSPDFR